MGVRRVMLSILVLSTFLIGSTTSCLAQDEGPAHQNVLSANPFLAAFGWYTAEYERVLTNKYSLGISGSFVELGDDEDGATYSGGDLTLRLFPQENAPGGLFFGGRLGMRQVEETVTDGLFGPGETTTDTASFAAAGFEIGFTYLFGVKQNYALSVGAGVVKLFGGDLEEESTTLPTIRVVNLGMAF
jgi:hypothetical protein